MKMTIVIDSTDAKGIESAYEIASLMKRKYGLYDNYTLPKESFTKIELIKVIRQYVQGQVEALEDENNEMVKEVKNMYSLRNTKRFVDQLFHGKLKY
jgi:hypothetical protein